MCINHLLTADTATAGFACSFFVACMDTLYSTNVFCMAESITGNVQMLCCYLSDFSEYEWNQNCTRFRIAKQILREIHSPKRRCHVPAHFATPYCPLYQSIQHTGWPKNV